MPPPFPPQDNIFFHNGSLFIDLRPQQSLNRHLSWYYAMHLWHFLWKVSEKNSQYFKKWMNRLDLLLSVYKNFIPHEKCVYFWTRNQKVKSVIESQFHRNLSSTLLGILHWWNTIKLIAIDSTEKGITSQFFSPFLFSFTIFDLFTLYNFLHHFHNKSGCKKDFYNNSVID